MFNVKRKAVSRILVTLLLIGMMTSTFDIQSVSASGTIYIRADGSVDPTTAPISTVDKVTYTFTDHIYDEIVVERDNIVVDGAGFTQVSPITGDGKGIDLYERSNVTIKNTEIKAFNYGIYLRYSNNIIISGNTIAYNDDCGVSVDYSSNNNVSGNTIASNVCGIYVDSLSSVNTISGNNIANNGGSGVRIEISRDNTISGNNISNNGGYGVSVTYWSSNNTISGNNIANNGLNGVFFTDSRNNTISGTNIANNGFNGVCFSFSRDNTISGNNISNNGFDGVRFANSSNNTISGTNIANNRFYGVAVVDSSNNTISGNTIAYNDDCGVDLYDDSSFNTISGNTIASSDRGVHVDYYSSNNTISGNMIRNNGVGVSIQDSSDNVFCHNDFIDNDKQVMTKKQILAEGPANVWDDGYPPGGNYWSDYAGVDLYSGPYQSETGSDGIGDTPYVIDDINQDRYPLMVYAAEIGVSILLIRPNVGGNTGSVTVKVEGSGFQPETIVRLTKQGHTDIEGINIHVANPSLIITTFNLSGRTPGIWDVVVTPPDAAEIRLPEAFNILFGGQPSLWVDIIGRDLIRIKRETSFYIIFGNTGIVDAMGVPLWIAGIPKDVEWSLDFEITPPLIQVGAEQINWDEIPIHIETDDEIILPLFIPLIPPDFVGILRIKLIVPDQREFQLRVWANRPYFQSPMNPNSMDCSVELSEFILKEIATEVIGTVFPIACFDLLGDIITNSYEESIESAAGEGMTGYTVVHSSTQSFTNFALKGLSCAAFFVPPLRVYSTVATWLSRASTGVSTIMACIDSWDCALAEAEQTLGIMAVTSIDPNEKAGSHGTGEPQYISGQQSLRYVIFFENLETATAPAQEVIVEDQLDESTMDLSTLSLGLVAFGDYQMVPPSGSTEYQTEIDLRPDMDLIVRINVALDRNTGLLTWRFSSIDPATGTLPEDPLAGFLPPNLNPPDGEGSVMFIVMPEQALPTGTQIRNRAKIVFDVNPPIETPEWINTLDNTKPTSRVHSLAASQDLSGFNVEWSGEDDGSGILDYGIYVSDDNGSYTSWMTRVTNHSATFTGEKGHTYAFYSIAVDNVGNTEEPPAQPDTRVRVRTKSWLFIYILALVILIIIVYYLLRVR